MLEIFCNFDNNFSVTYIYHYCLPSHIIIDGYLYESVSKQDYAIIICEACKVSGMAMWADVYRFSNTLTFHICWKYAVTANIWVPTDPTSSKHEHYPQATYSRLFFSLSRYSHAHRNACDRVCAVHCTCVWVAHMWLIHFVSQCSWTKMISGVPCSRYKKKMLHSPKSCAIVNFPLIDAWNIR